MVCPYLPEVEVRGLCYEEGIACLSLFGIKIACLRWIDCQPGNCSISYSSTEGGVRIAGCDSAELVMRGILGLNILTAFRMMSLKV